jgi:WD40 repeat protein
MALAVAPGGDRVAWGDIKGKVTLLDLNGPAPQPLQVLPTDHTNSVRALAFHPFGRVLYSAGDGPIRVSDLEAPAEKPERLVGKEDPGRIRALAVSRDGRWLASGNERGRVVLWWLPGQRPARAWTFPPPIVVLAIAPDSRHLAVGDGKGVVSILRFARPPAFTP